MSISFNDLNGPNVSDSSGNTTLGTLSSQGADGQRGLNNTAVGFGALRTNGPSVQHNTAIGLNALSNNAGSDNVAIGENALYNYLTPTVAQTGNYNVAVGNNAIQCNTSGYQNVALGNQALNNNTTGYLNVAIGNNAMEGTDPTSATGSYNVAIGNQALNDNISGSYNAVVGNAAGYFNTTGKNNAALGANALLNNTTGNQNVAIGKEALQSSQTTTGNVAVGHHALKNHITGSGNIGIGNHALNASTTGSNNVGIGSGVSSNNNDSCILLGNGAQTVVSNEIGIGGINLATPPSPAPPITGYLPVRMSNSTLSNKLYYVPMYDPSVPSTLPIPEVIIANHSSLGTGGTGGVGLLIGFPVGYSAASSVTIKNGTYSVVINSPISTSGYYVYYEDQQSGFWSSSSLLSYSNIAQAPRLDADLCHGMVDGFSLIFTYVLSGISTDVTYQPLSPQQMDIGDGYQYEKYFGSGSPQDSPNGFQWGRKPGGGGSEVWGTQTGSGTQTYAQWQAVASDYQYNSIYKYLYPYSTVSGPPGPTSASMTWPVTKSFSSITNGATYTIGGTDIPAPTITGVTGTAPTITYNISCDSNMPSITLTNGSTLTVGWDAWSTSVSTGLLTNVYIIASATIQGTLTSAYLTTVLTVGSGNTLTWAVTPYTQLTAPTLYTIPTALTFSASPPYYTNTAAFTVTNTYTNVAITSTGASSAVTSNGVTTITPQAAGFTIITATSSTGKTRTLLTIAASPSSGVTSLYSQMTNPTLISPPLAVAPNTLPPSQQFIANEFGSNISGIIDYFHLPFIQFANVQTSVPFTMTLAKNGTTLVTTTFSLPGNAGTTYLTGINIPFLLQSAASNNPSIIFTFNPSSPTSTTTTITNLDQITISLNATSTISGGTWQIKMSGGEMAGTVYGTSTQFLPLTVPTFTPASLTFADVVYTSGLAIPFTLVSNSNGAIAPGISPSDMGTISEFASSGGAPSYRVNVLKPGTATITFTQSASGSFSGKTITATLKVLNASTITFSTSVVNSQMIYATGKTVALNDASKPAATSTNINAPITYTLTGVSNIGTTTNPCATITPTGTGASTLYTLNLLGFGSFTLVASQGPINTYGPGTASLPITLVPGDGPGNSFALNKITSNGSTAQFDMELSTNPMNIASMAYVTNINAVVTYFNIPKFNVVIDNVKVAQTAQFTLNVFRGPAGSTPNIPVSTTTFAITTNASGVYNPSGGITVPLSTPISAGESGYMETTNGVLRMSSTSGQGNGYPNAITTPQTQFSISTTTPNIMIVLTPFTNVLYGTVTMDVNTNGPNSGMLGTLYGYIQLLNPNLTFGTIPTPITWYSNKTVAFNPATSAATDSGNIIYTSSATSDIATIPVATTNSMTLAKNQPPNPTNVITISASRAATAIYANQTVSINPSSTPSYPICIKTYALNNGQKIAYTNPGNIVTTYTAGSSNSISFIASESFTSLDSLSFAFNSATYGYNFLNAQATFTVQLTISGTSNSTTNISFTTIAPSSAGPYNSNMDGTLREIPFSNLINYPTYVNGFNITGTANPSCFIGDRIVITMSYNIPWYISADDQSIVGVSVVGSSSTSSLPKILYMTSSIDTLATTSVNSNTFIIFKTSVITGFQVAGIKTQSQVQSFTLNAKQQFSSSNYFMLSIAFTYDFGANYATTFSSIQIPFSYIEYSRLYPNATPMTSFKINIDTTASGGGPQSTPTPFFVNINDKFSCVLGSTSVGNFTVNTQGNLMSGSVYGYELLANPNLGALTLKTPYNIPNTPIAPPSTSNSSPTFTYTATGNAAATISSSNILTLTTANYANVNVTATMSETNQYFTASVSQNIDVITRTKLPPNTYSMTTISASGSSGQNPIYQYANVVSYSSATVPLYGYGFFNIGSSDNNYYSSSPGGQHNLSFDFIISKYQSGGWNTVRTISISYNQKNVNSNDDGSLFIIPFYNTFANGAPTYLPFRNMPSNINGFTVVPNDTSDSNSPPTFNVGDTLQFQVSLTSVNSGQTFPTNNNQLSGTVLSSSSVAFNAVLVNPNSYSSNQWTSVSLTNQPTSNSYPYIPPADVILTGINLYPMSNIPASTYFTIRVNLGSTSGFMTIQGVTIGANAFNGNTPIWFTMTPDYPNPTISITNISVAYASDSLINKGQPVSTNPLVSKSTAITFSIVFTNLGSTTYTALNYWLDGQAYSSIPGVFYGRLL